METRIVPLSERFERALEIVSGEWGGCMIVSMGRATDLCECSGFVCETDKDILGIITYKTENGVCEIITLNSFRERRGIASNLIERVYDSAKSCNAGILRVVTTNDNVNAIRYYQKRGFSLTELRLNAVTDARKIKPSIPLFGIDGIPISHELVFERYIL